MHILNLILKYCIKSKKSNVVGVMKKSVKWTLTDDDSVERQPGCQPVEQLSLVDVDTIKTSVWSTSTPSKHQSGRRPPWKHQSGRRRHYENISLVDVDHENISLVNSRRRRLTFSRSTSGWLFHHAQFSSTIKVIVKFSSWSSVNGQSMTSN